MATEKEVASIQAMFARLEGMPCWHVSAGGCTWPSFNLAMGDRIPRRRPLSNERQPKEFRENDPSASLLVWTSWRLESASLPVASSEDREGVALPELEKLIGRTVVGARVLNGCLDLELAFSGDLAVRVFCGYVTESSGMDENWQFNIHGGKTVAAVLGGRVETE